MACRGLESWQKLLFLTSLAFEVDTGCGRLAVVWPPVMLLSCHLVYRSPRASTSKLYRLFWWVASVVACRGFESQRCECKNWRKFSPLRWFSVSSSSLLWSFVVFSCSLVEVKCCQIVPNSYGHGTSKCNEIHPMVLSYILEHRLNTAFSVA